MTSLCSRDTLRQMLDAALTFSAALLFVAVAMTHSVQAQTLSTLYNFTYGADGGFATAGLNRDAAGNLYGTTEAGGNLNCSVVDPGCGVVFKLSNTGQESVLYTFGGGRDGADPQAGLVLDVQGNLYGTTARGGDPNCAWGQGKGCGTIFKVTASGKETVLYRFRGGEDGAAPAGTLLRDASGNLWGTTQFEGLMGSQCFSSGCGTVFKLEPSGKLIVHKFQGPPTEGFWPLAGMISDSVGNLYGTTLFGGTYNSGTVFRVDQTGEIKTLHNFDINTGDAANPTGLLLFAGKLYGAARSGGTDDGGAVYELTPAGDAVLYSFLELNDNLNPMAQGVLSRDRAGNLYGTTLYDGEGNGTVYKVDAVGNYSVVHAFGGGSDGQYPASGVIRDSAGNLYGTTQFGGSAGGGTIFKITP